MSCFQQMEHKNTVQILLYASGFTLLHAAIKLRWEALVDVVLTPASNLIISFGEIRTGKTKGKVWNYRVQDIDSDKGVT